MSDRVNEDRIYDLDELFMIWEDNYGEDFEEEYDGLAANLRMEYPDGLTRKQLAEEWKYAYDEDMQNDYSGFYKFLGLTRRDQEGFYDEMRMRMAVAMARARKYNQENFVVLDGNKVEVSSLNQKMVMAYESQLIEQGFDIGSFMESLGESPVEEPPVKGEEPVEEPPVEEPPVEEPPVEEPAENEAKLGGGDSVPIGGGESNEPIGGGGDELGDDDLSGGGGNIPTPTTPEPEPTPEPEGGGGATVGGEDATGGTITTTPNPGQTVGLDDLTSLPSLDAFTVRNQTTTQNTISAQSESPSEILDDPSVNWGTVGLVGLGAAGSVYWWNQEEVEPKKKKKKSRTRNYSPSPRIVNQHYTNKKKKRTYNRYSTSKFANTSRRIERKEFRYVGGSSSKNRARMLANAVRRNGVNARVIPHKGGYSVYFGEERQGMARPSRIKPFRGY
jgi:hypothetical protein